MKLCKSKLLTGRVKRQQVGTQKEEFKAHTQVFHYYKVRKTQVYLHSVLLRTRSPQAVSHGTSIST